VHVATYALPADRPAGADGCGACAGRFPDAAPGVPREAADEPCAAGGAGRRRTQPHPHAHTPRVLRRHDGGHAQRGRGRRRRRLGPRFFHRVDRHERRVPLRAGSGQRRGGPAGDDGGRGRRWRGDLLRGVPGWLRGRRRAEDDAVRARVPRGVHRGVALRQLLLPALPLQAADPGGGGRRRPTPTGGAHGIDDDGRVRAWQNATFASDDEYLCRSRVISCKTTRWL
jgi:hypothetical protein